MSDKMIVFLLVVSAFIGAFIANTLTTRRLTKLREEDLKRHQKQQLLQEILIRLDALCTPSMKLDVNKPVMTTHELSTVEIYRNGPVKQALFMYKRHYAVTVEAADLTLWLTADNDTVKSCFYSGLGDELNDLQFVHRELEKALIKKQTEKETTLCS
jgi:hypothetical protein